MFMRRILLVASLGSISLASCGGEERGRTPASMSAGEHSGPPQVLIVEPADGDTVVGPAVTVRLQAHGLAIVPAGDTTPNSGHHHLFLDRDLTPAGTPIPTEPGYIVHLGTGGDTYTFDSVAPGPHRLIAVVGDAVHVPLNPWVVDTVHFVVRAP
ncbi:MAG: hypothetical protein KatS3mg081_2582 [Gemmatimonadales bacterium]|nr:MAG: hypothetical protein KatS3mg081_2582 [Gemmatimonadales bacterium]